MKNKILLIIVILLGISLFFFFHGSKEKIHASVSIIENENIFPVYEEHKVSDLIKESNVEILSKEELLENDTLGKHTYPVKIKAKNKVYTYHIDYEIKDLTPPVLISAPSTLTILDSDTEDICKKIVYADNYDGILACKVKGEYHLEQIGTYKNLEFVITDSSGNQTKWPFTLNIVKEIPKSNTSSTPKYVYIKDIIKEYKNDHTSIGIDISRWQGNVDFEAVKEAGVEFVIMRIGTQRSINDTLDMDSRFEEYYENAKKVGLKIGVYVYNTATTKEKGRDTAKWVIEQLHGDKLDFPVAFDFEDWSNFMDYQVSLYSLSSAYLEFERTLKENGYDAMLYSSKYYLEHVWMNYENSNVWLAHYTSKTNYQGNYMLWQMTSLAKINGITQNTVDIDILYK